MHRLYCEMVEHGGRSVSWRDVAMQRLSSRADDPAPSVHDLTQRVVALRGVFGHEGQGGSAAPEPVEATKACSSSLTSLG